MLKTDTKIILFAFKLSLFVSLICLLSGMILFMTPVNNHHYLMAFKHKQELLKKTKSPRIILAGCSSLAFGVDSQRIEKELGLPVINLGLHGGFRLEFILNTLKGQVNKGDIVVFILEYSHFTKDLIYGETALFQAALYNPEIFNYFECRHYIQMVKYIPSLLNIRFKDLLNSVCNVQPDINNVYNSLNFNSNGDFIGHIGKPSKKTLIGTLQLDRTPSSLNKVVNILNNFYMDEIVRNNANCFIVYPCVPAENINKQRLEVIETIKSTLKSELTFKCLGSPITSIIPKTYFYDTLYHLNTNGREWNTMRIIHLLKSIEKPDSK